MKAVEFLMRFIKGVICFICIICLLPDWDISFYLVTRISSLSLII